MELNPSQYGDSRSNSSRQLRQTRTATSVPGDSEDAYRTYTAPAHISNYGAEEIKEATVKPTHQRFLFTDQVALRYLEEDSSTTVLDRRRRLEGYQLYIVEQWACSRVHPTFVLTTYTGDPSHSVVVSVLSVPADERTWSPRLKVYFKAVSQYYARRKETRLGTLLVTNLSGFPSALTVIPVPEGDGRKHREDFFVNENLKRLGCSGRAGLTLSPPTDATQAKFHQLYRTSDRIPLYQAVLEMVKLCQGALTIFDKLAPEYVDGLLCDITEGAINDWWTEIGTEFYNVEPSDGILGPTTVAALLGMLMGARNRLNAFGAPVAKDAFDLECLKRGIAYFQKAQKLPRTRRLDRQTIDKLHRATAKAASGDGWQVPKAVKSTMAELSGKGGEMMMEMVGAREKAGIADIETLDIETFVQLIHGERGKWLWYGKPRKGVANEPFGPTAEDRMVFGKDDQGGYIWSSRKKENTSDEPGSRRIEDDNDTDMRRPSDSQGSLDNIDPDPYRRKPMFRSVTGRMSDARSGFGRFKDAISRSGTRGHQRGSKSDMRSQRSNDSPFSSAQEQQSDLSLSPTKSYQNYSQKEIKRSEDGSLKQQPITTSNYRPSQDRELEYPANSAVSKLKNPDLYDSQNSLALTEGSLRPTSSTAKPPPVDVEGIQSTGGNLPGSSSLPSDRSAAPSVHDPEPDVSASKPPAETAGGATSLLLRHTQSASSLVPKTELANRAIAKDENRYPRHLSFSMVEDAVLPWTDICAPTSVDISDPIQAYNAQSYLATTANRTANRIHHLESNIAPWVESKLAAVESLDAYGAQKQEELHALYMQRLDEYRALQAGSEDLIAAEKSHLEDAIKEVETLGAKLEYELSSLVSKVEDVEDGVSEFEKQVLLVEARARHLEDEGKSNSEGWGQWFCRVMLGYVIGGGGGGGSTAAAGGR
ncbi:MAG: hypothetical protein M1819_000720 [Sarea resinae]|nr:MAG: hypothetical protein M1819_000720 [Sarea resinae]